jgi:hypothetical protein
LIHSTVEHASKLASYKGEIKKLWDSQARSRGEFHQSPGVVLSGLDRPPGGGLEPVAAAASDSSRWPAEVMIEEVLDEVDRVPKVDATERRGEDRLSSSASPSVTTERVAEVVSVPRVDIEEGANELGLEFREGWFGRGSRGPSTRFQPHFSDSPQVQPGACTFSLNLNAHICVDRLSTSEARIAASSSCCATTGSCPPPSNFPSKPLLRWFKCTRSSLRPSVGMISGLCRLPPRTFAMPG